MIDLADILRRGELELEGRLIDASNTTLRGSSTLDGVSIDCVYKPRRGERPLWDFPGGTLSYREVAAFELSHALGWDLIPTTVWRESGPAGAGMCQAWIHAAPDATPVDVLPSRDIPKGWLAIAEGEGVDGRPVCLAHEDAPDLRRLAVLDVLLNNADRKGGHILRDGQGTLFGIDHGLTFHDEDKLRTVLWGWTGDPCDPADLADVERLLHRLRMESDDLAPITDHLTRGEARALLNRTDRLLHAGTYPEATSGWPALPWPVM